MTHFIGIGGIGMSSLARILLKRGLSVSGSDLKRGEVTADLEQAGARIHIGHHPDHLAQAERVVYSSAVKEHNLELCAAQTQGIPLLHRSQLLAELLHEKKGICIAGAHGKSSTSAFLYWALKEAGLDPSFSIGAMVNDGEGNGNEGTGEYLVAEADESDGSFLAYHPFAAIVTNIDLDHLDYWKDPQALFEGYRQFISQVPPERLVYCSDDPLLSSWDLQGVGYGFHSEQLRAENVAQKGDILHFDIVGPGVRHAGVTLNAIGSHFALNALAVYGMCAQLGICPIASFATFPGLKRRYEKKGEKRGIAIYDDYAHHPAEVKAVLRGFKEAFPGRRIVAYFQPHRYTRLRDFFSGFREAFIDADLPCIAPVYSAGEEPIEGVTAEALALAIPGASYLASKDQLLPLLREGDVVITMGAGDVTYFSEELLSTL